MTAILRRDSTLDSGFDGNGSRNSGRMGHQIPNPAPQIPARFSDPSTARRADLRRQVGMGHGAVAQERACADLPSTRRSRRDDTGCNASRRCAGYGERGAVNRARRQRPAAQNQREVTSDRRCADRRAARRGTRGGGVGAIDRIRRRRDCCAPSRRLTSAIARQFLHGIVVLSAILIQQAEIVVHLGARVVLFEQLAILRECLVVVADALELTAPARSGWRWRRRHGGGRRCGYRVDVRGRPARTTDAVARAAPPARADRRRRGRRPRRRTGGRAATGGGPDDGYRRRGAGRRGRVVPAAALAAAGAVD